MSWQVKSTKLTIKTITPSDPSLNSPLSPHFNGHFCRVIILLYITIFYQNIVNNSENFIKLGLAGVY